MSEAAAPSRRVGVRDLARFALRRGDLEIAPAGPSARDGQLVHQRLQREALASANGIEAEVTLTRVVELNGCRLTVGGRIDLFDRERSRLIEIKSTLVSADRLPPGRRALDRAQLALYAWLLGDDAPAELELLYVNLRDGARTRAVWRPDREVLECETRAALTAWLEHALRLEARRAALSTSSAVLAFPQASMRPGQRRMAVAAYRAIRDGESLLVEAPTGTGKTLGVLFPAVRALGEGRARRLCWLTAKRSGREAVLDALRRLIDAGLAIDALVLRSRRDGCRCERDPSRRLDDGRCPEAIGFHDRLPAARVDAIGDGAAARLLDGAALDALAERHRLCAHALADDLLGDATVVVCDFNQLLDPIAARATLADAEVSTAVLIDEAHHLPARGRAMFSARLSRLDCLQASALARALHPGLSRALERLVDALRSLPPPQATASGTERVDTTEDDVQVSMQANVTVRHAVAAVLEALTEARESASDDPPFEPGFALSLHRMHTIGHLFGSTHRELVRRRTVGGRREIIVEWTCLDAAALIGATLRRQRSTIAFSAALRPMHLFRDALGLDPVDTRALTVASPFDPARLHAQLIDWIPVAYRDRERSEDALIDLIDGAFRSRRGHWIVFAPSHAWLERLHARFTSRHRDVECWRQSDDGGAGQVEHRLERLDRSDGSVGFAITGGVFGEGVDYVGERLIGAIVIGTGLPPRDARLDLMIEHHDRAGRPGYDLVCRQPALLRTLQSGGRVIRGVAERGALLLVDDRFDDAFHRSGLPPHWTARRPGDLAESRRLLARFWQQAPDRNARSDAENRLSQQANARGIEGCHGRSDPLRTVREP